MTSEADFVQPPRIACWLLNLFSPPEEQNRSWVTCLRSIPFSRRNRELPWPEDGIGGKP